MGDTPSQMGIPGFQGVMETLRVHHKLGPMAETRKSYQDINIKLTLLIHLVGDQYCSVLGFKGTMVRMER